jgi:hypothetical protein
MAKDKEKNNAWFREYYKTHKQQYFDKAARYKKEIKEWFYSEYQDILFCSECGEKNRCCLDFHHLDPSKKDKGMSQLLRMGSKKRIIEEVKKCVVVCANCHRKIHCNSEV